jgi:DUF971 family protein
VTEGSGASLAGLRAAHESCSEDNARVSSYVAGGEYLSPRRIHADRAARTLTIEWADGHATVYDFTTLRWLCPCAYCRGEAGIPGWLDANPTLSPAQTELVDLQLVGQYAVAPIWADGHRTGFYTFDRLREECPCAEHRGKRPAGSPPGTRGTRPTGVAPGTDASDASNAER